MKRMFIKHLFKYTGYVFDLLCNVESCLDDKNIFDGSCEDQKIIHFFLFHRITSILTFITKLYIVKIYDIDKCGCMCFK